MHRLEPYVYAQMIAGKDAVRHGEAKNSWLTGTAAWNFVAISQHILGVKPELDGLRVDPCIGAEIPSFTIVRRCRGAEYRIRVTNAATGKPARLARRREADRGHAGAVRAGRRDRHDRLRGLKREGPSRSARQSRPSRAAAPTDGTTTGTACAPRRWRGRAPRCGRGRPCRDPPAPRAAGGSRASRTGRCSAAARGSKPITAVGDGVRRERVEAGHDHAGVDRRDAGVPPALAAADRA